MRRARPTRRPNLPSIPAPTDPRFGAALKELLETFVGARGDQNDRVVTFRDLQEQAVAQGIVDAAGGATGGSASAGAPGSGPVQFPTGVSGLVAAAAHRTVVLTWTRPAFAGYSLTEIWRSTENDISSASQVGATQAPVYVDNPGGGAAVYYWVRHVSTSGMKGTFSASVSATTSPEHQQILDAITSVQWQAATNYSLYSPIAPTTPVYVGDAEIRLVAVTAGVSGATEPDWSTAVTAVGDFVADGTVVWQALEVGKIPFLIDPISGMVVIEGASIREASIEALKVKDGFFDSMTVAKGTLNEANIAIANIFNALIGDTIQSDDYVPGVSGWIIQRDGGTEFNDQYLRGLLHNGGLDAFGDPGPTTRYIDFRAGEPTEGDFVLGDVENGNFISFKYENYADGRILKIQGDVIIKPFVPGPVAYHENNLTSSESGLPNGYAYQFFPGGPIPVGFYSGMRVNVGNTQPDLSGSPIVSLSAVQSVRTTLGFGTVGFFNSSIANGVDPIVIKSTYVHGAGEINVKSNGTASSSVVWGEITGSYAWTKYLIPVIGLAIKRRNGSLTVVKVVTAYTGHESDIDYATCYADPPAATGKLDNPFSWSFDEDLTVNFGEEVQVVALGWVHSQYEQYGITPSATGVNDAPWTGLTVGCNYLGIFVEGRYETSSIK